MRNNAASDEVQRHQQQPQRQEDQLYPHPVDIPRLPSYGNVIHDGMVSALSEESAHDGALSSERDAAFNKILQRLADGISK